MGAWSRDATKGCHSAADISIAFAGHCVDIFRELGRTPRREQQRAKCQFSVEFFEGKSCFQDDYFNRYSVANDNTSQLGNGEPRQRQLERKSSGDGKQRKLHTSTCEPTDSERKLSVSTDAICIHCQQQSTRAR